MINFAANFAKLRDRFKDGFINRKAGAYLVRTGSVRSSRHSMRARSSLRGSRNNVLRGSRGSLKSLSVRGSNHVVNGANSTASTLRMTAYNNEGLSGDEIYAMRHLNNDYDREPDSLHNQYAERPLHPVPGGLSSRNGTDEPALSVTGTETGPPPSYRNGHPNGPAPSYTSSSVSGGNYPANSNPNMNYGGENHYPGSNTNSNFNVEPNSNLYYDKPVLDTVDGSRSVHGSVQHGSNEDNSDVVFGGRWGNQYAGYDRNRRPLTSSSEPEPAPSLVSAGPEHAQPRGFNEYFI